MADELVSKIEGLNITGKPQSTETGLVYDELMLKHESPIEHPECPARIKRIYTAMAEAGLVARCKRVPVREATREELLSVHGEDYLNIMRKSEGKKPSDLESSEFVFNSIYLTGQSHKCALLSAGGVVDLTRMVWQGDLANGMAVVRPPGHHAERDNAMGFCFFNNVAVAAELAVQKWGAKRVVIFDWDVHHGNGSQTMFEDNNKILYISMHRYMNGCFYPPGRTGGHTHVGTGNGAGYNVNIGWNHYNVTDGDVMAAMHFVLLPVLSEFGPDLVIVSSGFDAAIGDPLGGCALSPEVFGWMTHMLKLYAGGKIVLALEGGYNLNSISEASIQCMKSLLGDILPSPPPLQPCSEAIQAIYKTIDALSPFWISLGSLKTQITMLSGLDCAKSPTGAENPSPRTPRFIQQPPTKPLTRSAAKAAAKTTQDDSKQPLGTIGILDSSLDPRMDSIASAALAQGEENVTMYAVQPLPTCPHVLELTKINPDELEIDPKAPCAVCEHTPENWICLHCYKVLCSRYVKQHMVDHFNETNHCLTLSFSDLSVWCYGCDYYINSKNVDLHPYVSELHKAKFGHL
ncbi:histone deacetylase 6-like [Oopsacas minuta]|uniref:Histone deacetylase 6-like n=1 Tax=Oopsacas minuta TaxID=111878 RepID=A0AAV7KGS0_9METZ|nr:histone deacetylase 6-like [Oopsacas minuta]